MSSRNSKKAFHRACFRSGKNIREGGLKIEGNFAQVHESSYEPLARINELGLLTYNSQDAIDWRDGKIKMQERAYITGIMLPEDAKWFADLVNMNSDKVAFWQSPSDCAEIPSRIVLSKGPRGAGYRERFNYPRKLAEDVNESAGLRKNFPVVKVCVFDPVWGRPATSKDGLFGLVIAVLESDIYLQGSALHETEHSAW